MSKPQFSGSVFVLGEQVSVFVDLSCCHAAVLFLRVVSGSASGISTVGRPLVVAALIILQLQQPCRVSRLSAAS